MQRKLDKLRETTQGEATKRIGESQRSTHEWACRENRQKAERNTKYEIRKEKSHGQAGIWYASVTQPGAGQEPGKNW